MAFPVSKEGGVLRGPVFLPIDKTVLWAHILGFSFDLVDGTNDFESLMSEGSLFLFCNFVCFPKLSSTMIPTLPEKAHNDREQWEVRR